MATQRKVGSHRTTVRQKAGVLSVVYHQTEVVKADARTITLDSGGYRSATTKTRMNQASNQYDLGFVISQKASVWFVDYRGTIFTFVDGLEITRTDRP